MTVIAVSMVKDEADIVEHTVTRMLDQVDHVIVADNGSTDGTREILAGLPVELIDDPDPAYYQSSKMSHLASLALARGASWVVPFDADEVWYSPFGRVGDILAEIPARIAIATAQLFDHVSTGADSPDSDPIARIGWRRRDRAELPKIACRPMVPVTIEQGNHGASFAADTAENVLVVRHFPYRSPEQFVSKARNGAAAYAATDLPDHQGAHWRQYGAILDADGPGALEDVFRRWFWNPDPNTDPALLFDPCPT